MSQPSINIHYVSSCIAMMNEWMNEWMNEILYFTLVKNYTIKKPGKQKRHAIKGPAYINIDTDSSE